MIKVKVSRNNQNEIMKIDVSGHSGYDDIGKDIICSSVSTAMYVTVGIVKKVNPHHIYLENDKDAQMILEIKKSNSFTNIVLENLIDILESIAKDYSNFLQIINKN